jgi:hypothetical protein
MRPRGSSSRYQPAFVAELSPVARWAGGANDGTLYHDDRATTSTPRVNARNNLLQEHLTEQPTFWAFVIDAANKIARVVAVMGMWARGSCAEP